MTVDILTPDPGEPQRLRRMPELQRIRRGAYVDAATFADLPQHQRHLLHVRAVALSRPGAVFARESALALADLPHGRPDAVHIIGDLGATGRR